MDKHLEYSSDFQNLLGDIDFRFCSQTFGKSDKTVVFPVLENGIVVNLLACNVNVDRDYVKFRMMDTGNTDVKNAMYIFQSKINQSHQSREIEIEPVEIIAPGGSGDFLFAGLFTGTGGGGTSGGMDGGSGVHGTGGGGGGGTTTPPTNSQDPCAKVKTNLTDPKFTEKTTSLNTSTVLNYDHEMGYASTYTSIGNQFQPMDNKINTHNLTLPTGTTYFGFIHTHNNADGVIKMFSPGDVATFLTSCVAAAQTHGSISDAYAMVITSEGSYMLQYSGTSTSFGTILSSLSSWNQQYTSDMQNIRNDDGSFNQSDVESAFLLFLQNTVNISGLEVYKVDGTTSNKMTLNADKTVKSTPCP